MFLHSALHVTVGSSRYHTQLLKPWRNFPLWAQTTSYPLFLLPVWGSTLWASLPVNNTQTFPSQLFQHQSSSLNLCSFFLSPSHIALVYLCDCLNHLFTVVYSLPLSRPHGALWSSWKEERWLNLAPNWFVQICPNTAPHFINHHPLYRQSKKTCVITSGSVRRGHNHIPHNDR